MSDAYNAATPAGILPGEAMVTHADMHEAVRAATVGLASKADLEAAALASQAGAAPTSELLQILHVVQQRLGSIENVLGLITPAVNEAAAAAGVLFPVASPLLDRLPAVEATVRDVLSALNAHFGVGRIAGLPTADALPAAPDPSV